MTRGAVLLAQLGILLMPGVSFCVEQNNPTWEPMPMDEIRSIYEDRSLSDEQVVRALVGHLDRRLSTARPSRTTPLETNVAREVATLIRLIAERPYPADPSGRPQAVEAVLRDPGDVRNAEPLGTFLSVALGLAGGDPPPQVLLKVLGDPDTAMEITVVVLDAMAASDVPIRALPLLLERVADPRSLVESSGVGPPQPKRVFPVREAAIKCLTRLGIEAQRVQVEEAEVDPKWGERLSGIEIRIDDASLLSRLRGWLLSDDPQVWRAAIDGSRHLGRDDVAGLLADLERRGQFSEEKASYLHRK